MSTPARTSPLTAKLGELALADLLQTLVRTGKDAIVTIRHDGKQSYVWCEAGRVIDAESPPFVGNAAFAQILSIECGEVTAVFERANRAVTIQQPLERLILEHMRGWPAVSADEHPVQRPEHVPQAASRSSFRPRARSAATFEPWQGALTAEAVPGAEDEPTAKQRQMIAVIQKPVQPPSFVREPGRRRRAPLVLLASALGIGLGSWLGLQWRSTPTPPTPVTPLRAESPATAAPISLDVWAEPAHAELRLDGAKIAVGHALRTIADDGREHELEVSAEGYRAQTLRFKHSAPSGRIVLVPKPVPTVIAPQPPVETTLPVARSRRPRAVQADTLADETRTRITRPAENAPVLRGPKIRVIEAAGPKIKLLD